MDLTLIDDRARRKRAPRVVNPPYCRPGVRKKSLLGSQLELLTPILNEGQIFKYPLLPSCFPKGDINDLVSRRVKFDIYKNSKLSLVTF